MVERTIRDFIKIKGFYGILPGIGLFRIHALKLDAGYITPRRKKITPRIIRGEATAFEPRGVVLHHTISPKDSEQVIRVKRRGGCVRDPIGEVETWRLSIECKLRNLEPGARKQLEEFAALGIAAKLVRYQLKEIDTTLASATSCRRLGAAGVALLRARRGGLRLQQDLITAAKRKIANSRAYVQALDRFARECSPDAQAREYCMPSTIDRIRERGNV